MCFSPCKKKKKKREKVETLKYHRAPGLSKKELKRGSWHRFYPGRLQSLVLMHEGPRSRQLPLNLSVKQFFCGFKSKQDVRLNRIISGAGGRNHRARDVVAQQIHICLTQQCQTVGQEQDFDRWILGENGFDCMCVRSVDIGSILARETEGRYTVKLLKKQNFITSHPWGCVRHISVEYEWNIMCKTWSVNSLDFNSDFREISKYNCGHKGSKRKTVNSCTFSPSWIQVPDTKQHMEEKGRLSPHWHFQVPKIYNWCSVSTSKVLIMCHQLFLFPFPFIREEQGKGRWSDMLKTSH